MCLDPMLRDVEAADDPDVGFVNHVVEEAFETHGTSGMPDEAGMQTNGHHFGLRCTFFVKDVEGIADE